MSDPKRLPPGKTAGTGPTASMKAFGGPQGHSLGTAPNGEAIRLTKKDRAAHTHIIGSSGSGKSKFIELLLRQDIKDRDCGVCVIDPHGLLYHSIVTYVAQEYPYLAERFVLFDPAGEYEQIAGFNPIPSNIEHFDYTLNTLVSACLKAWGQYSTDSTPRITRWLQNIFYPILAKKLTLLEAAPLIDVYAEAEREALLAGLGNSMIMGDWLAFERLPATQKQQQMEGAGNRLRKFLGDGIVRNIIGQKEKVLDLAQIMAEGKVLLVNLENKGKIGEENAQLLGILLINEIVRVAKLRDPRDPATKPFYFYIDEFGQFVTREIAKGLEECRKYKLFFILAHQHLAQLKKEDEYLCASVMTNCRNKVVFGGLQPEDVELMSDDLFIGHVNLKAVKDEVWRISHRYQKEERISETHSTAQMRGSNQSSTDTVSESHAEGRGESFGESRGITDSQGQSFSTGRNEGQSEGRNQGTTRGHSEGEGESLTKSEGTSEQQGQGWSKTDSKTKTKGQGRGWNESQSEGTSRSLNHSDTHGNSQGTSQSESKGTSSGQNWSDSKGTSETLSQSETQGQSTTRGQTTGRSETRGTSSSSTDAVTQGRSRNTSNTDHLMPDSGDVTGRNRGYGETESESRSSSQTRGSNHSTSNSYSESLSHSDSRSSTTGRGQGTSQQHSEGGNRGENESRSTGRNQSSNQSHTEGQSEGTQQSRSSGKSHNETESQGKGTSIGKSGSHTTGKNQSESRGQSRTRAENYGESEGTSESRNRGTSESEGVNFSHAESRQESHSRNTSATDTRGTSHGATRGTSEARTESQGYTKTIVDAPVEFEELSNRTYWTKDEMHYMAMSAVKNQNVGEAFVKIGNTEPLKLKVAFVKDAEFNEYVTPIFTESFRETVFQENAHYYTPLLEIRVEYEERQRRIFGEPLRFDETLSLPAGVIDIEAVPTDDDYPFEG